MIPIRKHGGLLRADSNGFLARDASLKKITPPWLAAVDFVKASFLNNLGDAVHSIYIRGSVPRGLAVEGLSDIDTYFVVYGGPDACRQLDFSWLDEVRAEFSHKFQFAAGMERMCIPLANIIGADPDNFKWHFMIKVNSVCLYGEDLSRAIPPIKLDQIIGPEYSTLAKDIAFFNRKMDEGPDEEGINDGCRWIMKRFLREGMRLVMMREQAYTRDLYPAFECFAKYYPQQEVPMRNALEWAINPLSDLKQLRAFVSLFGEWLCQTLESPQDP